MSLRGSSLDPIEAMPVSVRFMLCRACHEEHLWNAFGTCQMKHGECVACYSDDFGLEI